MKAQVSNQIYVYIFAVIVVAVTLIIGYTSIRSLIIGYEASRLETFQNQFIAEVQEISQQYESQKEYSLEIEMTEACFVSSMENDVFPSAVKSALNTGYPFYHSVSNDVKKNVFLIKEDMIALEFYVDNLEVNGGIICVEKGFAYRLKGADGKAILT